MAEIDPITRDALRRATQVQGRANRNNPQREPERHHNQRPPKPSEERPPEPQPSHRPKPPSQQNGLEALFKDKETSVILILIVLLMGEKNCEHLLLALIYLLI